MNTLLQEAQEHISNSGGRMTPQRRLILETLDNNEGHLTAEELYQILKPSAPELNLSTVYRNLRWLEQEGLIGSRWFDSDRGLERFDAGMAVEHHHFVCSECRRVIEFRAPQADEIKQQFEKSFGGKVDTASIALTGVCLDCISKKEGIGDR
jgi:Fe2+ or Zn2+ uptake regulation protein